MKQLLCAVLLLCAYASAQQINPNQIQPSTTNGYVMTTQGGVTSWQPSTGGFSLGLAFGSTNIPNSSTAPTSGQCLGYNGTNILGVACGGGSSLPTATAAGQMLSSTAAGTTYAVQGQIFYAQSGDTIASIESECSSLCTYVVTTSQTITLAANHTLNANVVLRMEAGGAWTVNGTGFTLSGIQVAPGSTLTQHFVAGTGSVALSAKNTLVPVEWFGAMGDWNGTTGTDNTTAIQNTLNAIVGGQALLQCRGYKTTAALTISTSSIGIAGMCYGYPATGAGVPSYLISTSASADVIDVAGTSPSASLTWNKFNDFAIDRSVVPTGTATGLSLNYVGGYTIDRIAVNDSVRGFYLHSTPAYGFGIISNSEAAWGAAGVTETSGSYYGFYLDSADGNAENSLRMLHDNAETNSLPGITSYGIYMYGSAINDVMVDGFETALVTYGKWVQFTSGGTAYASGDIHFWNCIDDGFYASAYYITNVTAAKDGTIDIAGARISSGNTTTGNGGIDIENSAGVTISHSQIGSGNIVNGIYASGSSSLTITGNTFQDLITTDIDLNNTNASAVTGNTFWGSSTKVPYIMVKLDGTASYNTVSGNSFSGYNGSYAIFANTSTTNNALIAGNSIDTTHMTNGGIGDAGTNNNLVAIPGTGMAISGSTLAVTPLTITNSHTSGVNINFSNTSTGGKSWYLLSQGSGAGLGLSAGETAFYDATDSTLTFSMTNARVKSWLPLYVGSSNQFQVDASGNTSVTNPTAATSGSNANSPNMVFGGHAWNGAASVASAWTCYDNLTSWSGSPSSVQPLLECDYSGYSSGAPNFKVPALSTTTVNTSGGFSSGDWIVFNSNPATSGANYSSPNFGFHGNYWTGAATNSDQWNIQDVLGAGSNPTNTLTVTHPSGSTGYSSVSFGMPVTAPSVNSILNAQLTAGGTPELQIENAAATLPNAGMVIAPPGMSGGNWNDPVFPVAPAGVTIWDMRQLNRASNLLSVNLGGNNQLSYGIKIRTQGQSSASGNSDAITSCSVTSNVATVNAANAYSAGNLIWIWQLSGGCAFLNNTLYGSPYTVVSATGTTFTFAFTHANLGLTTDSGQTGIYQTAAYGLLADTTLSQDSPNNSAVGGACATSTSGCVYGVNYGNLSGHAGTAVQGDLGPSLLGGAAVAGVTGATAGGSTTYPQYAIQGQASATTSGYAIGGGFFSVTAPVLYAEQDDTNTANANTKYISKMFSMAGNGAMNYLALSVTPGVGVDPWTYGVTGNTPLDGLSTGDFVIQSGDTGKQFYLDPSGNETITGAMNAATGYEVAGAAAAGKALVGDGAHFVPTTMPQQFYWSIPPSAFAATTMIGAVYYAPYGTTSSKLIVRASGTLTCSTNPNLVIMDLGTSVSTVYSSATTLGTGVTLGTDGVSSATGASPLIAGHYYGVAFSTGTCTTPPTYDATFTAY